MEIKYCNNCGKEIRYCFTPRIITVYNGDFAKSYKVDLCDCCFRKLDKHIRRTVVIYKNRGVK